MGLYYKLWLGGNTLLKAFCMLPWLLGDAEGLNPSVCWNIYPGREQQPFCSLVLLAAAET